LLSHVTDVTIIFAPAGFWFSHHTDTLRKRSIAGKIMVVWAAGYGVL
jgi:hypothetical protein